MTTLRMDQHGPHRNEFLKNKKKILASRDICGICGKPVDKRIKYPDPLSPTIDHIIPIAKGGHPSDIANLQLVHFCCNRQKSDKILRKPGRRVEAKQEIISNRILPHSMDWTEYRGDR